MPDRVIIPFRWEDRIVGYTARKTKESKLKYLSDQHPHFVFNFNRQKENQQYILVVEGPFDALAVNGVALLTNEVSQQQARIINSLGATPIVIPDQDRAGLMVFDQAVELGWSVASPNWHDDVKDCAEAVKRYGKLFVIVDAITTACSGPIKINMAKKRLQQKLKIAEDEKDNN
jgi:DNA primase